MEDWLDIGLLLRFAEALENMKAEQNFVTFPEVSRFPQLAGESHDAETNDKDAPKFPQPEYSLAVSAAGAVCFNFLRAR